MSRHLISEPTDAFPYEPTAEDWDEFNAYVDECWQREEKEAFDEANRELSVAANVEEYGEFDDPETYAMFRRFDG